MPPEPSPVPVQKFRPSNGEVLGWGSIAVLAVVLVVSLVTEPNRFGILIALGLALAIVVVWAVLLRPRATAYVDTLVLHNMLSDTRLPLARVDGVTVRHTLNVWVDDRRYVCPGIGRSSRQLLGRRGGALSALGLGRGDARASGHGHAADPDADYAGFVETRIQELAQAARRQGGTPAPVSRAWAVPELAALGILGAAFVVSLLV